MRLLFFDGIDKIYKMKLNGILFNHSFSSANCFYLLGFLSFPHSVHGCLIRGINLIKSGSACLRFEKLDHATWRDPVCLFEYLGKMIGVVESGPFRSFLYAEVLILHQ